MSEEPKGPGRPRRKIPKEVFTIRLEPEYAAKFRAICEHNERSQSQQVADWVMKEDMNRQPTNENEKRIH